MDLLGHPIMVSGTVSRLSSSLHAYLNSSPFFLHRVPPLIQGCDAISVHVQGNVYLQPFPIVLTLEASSLISSAPY
jgi:hypothetical protein